MNKERLSLDNTEKDRADFDRAEHVLFRLGLSLKDLKDKKTLDLGSGGGELGRVTEKLGYDLISLDRWPHYQYPHLEEGHPVKESGKALHTPNLVQGDARALPFADEIFDLILSHAAPPNILTDERAEKRAVLQEARRVLKKGGEFRFGPVFLERDEDAYVGLGFVFEKEPVEEEGKKRHYIYILKK